MQNLILKYNFGQFFWEIFRKSDDESENRRLIKPFLNHDKRVPSVQVLFVREDKHSQIRGVVD